ncbi:tRNA 5-methoxyuridine(34)/uridine 5-oxyacetic acid(34) synthase CmoB [Isoalcanivorax indicus]|uniref:tRNA 5-methoxyuridine(34)/uridine 5-oxyacetic acid(34) synthase CmoB n=1 Tax=Isoalcanivorax indicus TaxID=2202653 RepID=UPI000DB96A1B|nr:tRNA 5-methoxyuridine(34)/uridine 5-oxyacetic acid(34) synthase CmoB [Isoalcanivorax indicus]
MSWSQQAANAVDLESYCAALEQATADLPVWQAALSSLSRERLLQAPHGDLPRWRAGVQQLPPGPAVCDVASDTLRIGVSPPDGATLTQGLRALMPWRKGPFSFFGTPVDTEWRSDWKWQRLLPGISPLAGRRVLDVGCGSGYHCWRMWGAGAQSVLGIDPGILFLMQFLAVKRFMPEAPVWLAPVRMEELPGEAAAFDTVFSMGVLYHRRSPLDHLLELRAALRPGGELVLETLVVDGDASTVLMPEDRYAMMRNVFFLPSTDMLALWLRRCGFEAVRVVDVCPTTTDEQRATDWMPFQSLPDFLDPDDATRTREGYPAPVRAVLVARRG